MNALELRAINKHYGQKHALKDFSFTFTEGVYALLGPNGAGKSTLMHLITDNLSPD
ncbi:MAG: AAA family ATPase, partial [Oscillospiraceae bacterium]|nr:AAA family ATPase [Oscillospiraceae bacterium]